MPTVSVIYFSGSGHTAKLAGGDAIGVSEESVLEITATKPSQVLLFDLN